MWFGDRSEPDYNALAVERCPGVQVTDRDSESVRSIRRLRTALKSQQLRDHHLHLLLLSPAVANYRGLDAERRVLANRDSLG